MPYRLTDEELDELDEHDRFVEEITENREPYLEDFSDEDEEAWSEEMQGSFYSPVRVAWEGRNQ